jgi:hypothetical protein
MEQCESDFVDSLEHIGYKSIPLHLPCTGIDRSYCYKSFQTIRLHDSRKLERKIEWHFISCLKLPSTTDDWNIFLDLMLTSRRHEMDFQEMVNFLIFLNFILNKIKNVNLFRKKSFLKFQKSHPLQGNVFH